MEGMKPLNEVAKKKATTRFVGIYGLSLLTVMLISYFLFSSPVKILKHDVRSYGAFKEQHDMLMSKLNTISRKATHIPQAGEVSNQDAVPDSLEAAYQEEVKKLLEDLKNYSDKETAPQVKEDINNYLSAYNAVLYYFQDQGNKIPEETNTTGNVTQADTKNSNESASIIKLNADIKTLNAERMKLMNENKRLTTLLDEGDKESIDKNRQAKLIETENERDMYKSQLNSKTEDVRIKDGIIKDLRKEKEDLIIECNKKVVPVVNTEDKSRLYQTVDKVIRKGKHSKKEVLVDFNNILRSLESTYPQRALLDKKVNEINKLMIGDF